MFVFIVIRFESQARSFATEFGAHGARLRKEEEDIDHLRAYIAVDRVGCETKRDSGLKDVTWREMLVVAETHEDGKRASLLLLLHDWGRGPLHLPNSTPRYPETPPTPQTT